MPDRQPHFDDGRQGINLPPGQRRWTGTRFTGDEVCELTELRKSGCAHCLGIPDLPAEPPEPAPALGPWFTARQEGRCCDCRDAIEPGDTIRASGRGGYLCVACGDAWEVSCG